MRIFNITVVILISSLINVYFNSNTHVFYLTKSVKTENSSCHNLPIERGKPKRHIQYDSELMNDTKFLMLNRH